MPYGLLCPGGFSSLECWGGSPCIPPGGLPNPGVGPRPPTFQVDSLQSEPPGKPDNLTHTHTHTHTHSYTYTHTHTHTHTHRGGERERD